MFGTIDLKKHIFNRSSQFSNTEQDLSNFHNEEEERAEFERKAKLSSLKAMAGEYATFIHIDAQYYRDPTMRVIDTF